MSDEIKNKENESDANEDKSNLIGVDPLAWLSDEEKTSVLNESKEHSTEASDVEKDGEEKVGKSADGSCFIKLNSAITIREITELMEKLNDISPDKTEIVFEAEHVEKVDAAAMQLLSGFYLFSIEAGKKVVWDKPSDAFCSAVTLLGLNDIINLPAIAA